jgi:hypothetical protein
LRNRDAEDVGNVLLCHVTALREHIHLSTFDRVQVGLLLRIIGPLWTLCSDLVLVHGLVHAENNVRAQHCAFIASVAAYGLDGVWK